MAGRPKKDKKYAFITFTAPEEFKEKLDAHVGEGNKSQFLRDAANAKIRLDKMRKKAE